MRDIFFRARGEMYHHRVASEVIVPFLLFTTTHWLYFAAFVVVKDHARRCVLSEREQHWLYL
jgi:cytochrome c oxidase assembly factor CtaG